MNIQKETAIQNKVPYLLIAFVAAVIFFVATSLLMFQKTQAEEGVSSVHQASEDAVLQEEMASTFSEKDLVEEMRTKQNILNDPLVVKSVTGDLRGSGKIMTSDSLVFYVNKERRKVGLEPLFVNQALVLAAEQKVKNMFSEQYFAHTSPKGEGLVDWIGSNYEYIAVGENLAMGDFINEQEIVTAWMNSEKHRESILKPSYVQTGVAIKKGTYKGETLWMVVQIFGIPSSVCPEIDKTVLSHIIDYENSLKDIENQIGGLSREMKRSAQPITKAEHQTFATLVVAYNQLVEKRKNILENLQETISRHNEQVQKHNVCAAEK